MKKKTQEAGSDEEVDALYQLPLNEFTNARNALAVRLKKAGQGSKWAKVKSLIKPSLAAWAANQLYWKHKEAFENLITTGQNLLQAQLSQLTGKPAEMDKAHSEQIAAISVLLNLSAELVRESGHNETPQMTRRMSRTLDALSIYPEGADAPTPGRLTADVEPLGFETISAMIPIKGLDKPQVKTKKVIPLKPPIEKETKQERAGQSSAIAKTALLDAEKKVQAIRKKVQSLNAAREKAAAEVNAAEKAKADAEERYQKAKLSEEEARSRFEIAATEADIAATELTEALRKIEDVRRRFES